MRRVMYALMTTVALASVWLAVPTAQMGNEDRVVPGGGITAGPGHNAAREIIRTLKRRRATPTRTAEA